MQRTLDPIKRIVICPRGNELNEYGPYKCKPDKFGYVREQFNYSNYKACQSCPNKVECCKDQKHRTITQYGHELLDMVENLMEIDEFKDEYKKRSRAECPFGWYKIYIHFNNLPIVGKENMHCMMNAIGLAYNLRRIFNIIKEKNIDWEDVFKVLKIITAPSSNFLCNGGMLK